MMNDSDKVKVQTILGKRKIELQISDAWINVFNNLRYKSLLRNRYVNDNN